MARQFAIRVPKAIAADQLAPIIDTVADDMGLTVTMRSTLKTFPGSTHWHFKLGSRTGTLEATWWPTRGLLWLTIQSGRAAVWTDNLAPLLARAIRSQFADRVESA